MRPYLGGPPLLTVTLMLLGAQCAYGHIILTSHITRDGRDFIKEGPCGRAGSERSSENVYVYEPGETITLEWDEFIPHPGHFRVAFDTDGDDDFVDPADYDDFYTNETVLLDNLFPHTREESLGIYTQEVTLPDVECERCTLQLTQMMTDKPPYVVGTNDLYYNCVDMTLRRSEPEPEPEPDMGAGAGGEPSPEDPTEGGVEGGVEGGRRYPEPPPLPYMGSESEDKGCASQPERSALGWWLLGLALLARAAWRSRLQR